MRIALVSSWLPRPCGIAIYSQDLVKAIRNLGHDVEVVTFLGGGYSGEENVHPVMDMRSNDWFRTLDKTLELIKPDLVHFQHEFGLYTLIENSKVDFSPSNAFSFFEPLFRLKAKSIPSVVTYHSVYSKLTEEETLYYQYSTHLATANIVHEDYQKLSLIKHLNQKMPNIFAIPHGTWVEERYDKESLKTQFGWQDRLIVGMIGYLEHTKGFDRIIKIWPEVVKRIPNAHLVIEGDVRPLSPSGEEAKEEILSLIAKSPVKHSIQFIPTLFDPEDNAKFISAFDLMVLPYRFASQSGNLAHAYGVGLPVVVSNMEGLGSSLVESKAGLKAKTDRDFQEAIIRLLQNPALRNKYAQNSLRYAKRVQWDKVASDTLKIYHWAKKKNLEQKTKGNRLEKRTHV